MRSYKLDSNLVVEVMGNGLVVVKGGVMFYRAHKDIENSDGLGLHIIKRHVEKS